MTRIRRLRKSLKTAFAYTSRHVKPRCYKEIIETTLFLKTYSILPIEGDDEEIPASIRRANNQGDEARRGGNSESGAADNISNEFIAKQNFISVNVNEAGSPLNVVGEIVTAQSMVITTQISETWTEAASMPRPSSCIR